MNNKGIKTKILVEADLVGAVKYSEKMTIRDREFKKFINSNEYKESDIYIEGKRKERKTKIRNNSDEMTRTKASKTKNSKEWKNSAGVESIKRRNDTMSKLSVNGITKFKEVGKKISKTKNTEFVDENGNITTINKTVNARLAKKRRAKSQRYKILHISGREYGVFYKADLSTISASLIKRDKDYTLFQKYVPARCDIKFKGLYVEQYFGYEPCQDINAVLLQWNENTHEIFQQEDITNYDFTA